jgi:putative ABC transport system substrate-binding protein
MKRRDFITLFGSAAATWPLAARGQQGERMRRIGLLMGLAESDPEVQARIALLARGPRDLGWTEGSNLRLEYHSGAGGLDEMRPHAAELVAKNPDLILADNTPFVQELQRLTRAIPIVFVGLGDPVESGVVASLARPGGNATGFMNPEFSTSGKWVELLKEIAPSVSRVLALVNAGNAGNQGRLRAVEAAAASFGVGILSSTVREAGDIVVAIEGAAREPNAGLIVSPGAPINDHRKLIFEMATRYRLPAVYLYSYYVRDGGLMSYGQDPLDMWRRAVGYVDRILRGERPSDLPVQAPTKYELIVNLKAAKAIGLTVPPSLLTRADDVIE